MTHAPALTFMDVSNPSTLPQVDGAQLTADGDLPPLPARLCLGHVTPGHESPGHEPLEHEAPSCRTPGHDTPGHEILVLEAALRRRPGHPPVFCARLGSRPVLARVFVGPGAQRRAARARSTHERLLEAGLPTLELIGTAALADSGMDSGMDGGRDGGRDGGVNGGQVLLSARPDDVRDGSTAAQANPAATCAALGALVGRGHRAGLRQRDAQLDGFLVRGTEAWLIDGDDFLATPMPRGAALIDELARLLAQLSTVLRPPAEALLAGWARGAGVDPAVDIDRLLQRLAFRRQLRLQQHLARARRSNSEFGVHCRGLLLQRVLRTAVGAELGRALRDPEALHRHGPAAGNGDADARRFRCAGRELLVYSFVPRFVRQSGLRIAIGSGPGERAWLALMRARFLGLPTPRPVALLERRLGPLVGGSWLVADAAVPAAPAATDAARLDVLRSACAQFAAMNVAPDAIHFCPLWIERGGAMRSVPLHALPAWLPPGRGDRWPEQSARLDAALLALAEHGTAGWSGTKAAVTAGG